ARADRPTPGGRGDALNTKADPYLPEGLPVAEVAAEVPADLALDTDQIERLRGAYEALPRRSRYVLTVRLGLGRPEQTLRGAAQPLALHLDRIRQIQLTTRPARNCCNPELRAHTSGT